jgi:hypothetical protein
MGADEEMLDADTRRVVATMTDREPGRRPLAGRKKPRDMRGLAATTLYVHLTVATPVGAGDPHETVALLSEIREKALTHGEMDEPLNARP